MLLNRLRIHGGALVLLGFMLLARPIVAAPPEALDTPCGHGLGEETFETLRVTPETFAAAIIAQSAPNGQIKRGSRFLLSPGRYDLRAAAYTDRSCGNCEDPATRADATLGLRISGREISLAGEGAADSVVIHTGAGYGILFEDCTDCELSHLTVTGGVRDPDPNATDAAVLARRSQVKIVDCVIRDNLGDSAVVAETAVGVIGIAGREDSRLTVTGCRILRNSWDGIALYRGAAAVISDNLIDGVDKASGSRHGGGRGVGIGATWDSRAEILHNRVTRYWKGIGVFVDAQAEIVGNVVEEMLTWGIAYWDAGRGRPVARIEGNIVYDTGACGISITRAAGGDPRPGSCTGNLVARTGQNPKYDATDYYCAQCPVAIHAQPEGFIIEGNWFFDNRSAFSNTSEGEPVDCLGREGNLKLSLLEKDSSFIDLMEHAVLSDARCFRELPLFK